MKNQIYFYLIAIALISGCARHYTAPTYSNASDQILLKDKMKKSSERKIIRETELRLLVKNPDTTNAAIIKIADKYKGYVVLSGNQSARIRVEASLMNEAIEDISKL